LFSSVQNGRALGSMIFARVVYALNWMNVGAIFYLMSSDLNAGVSGLGNVTAAFYLGIGLLQIPGGLLTAKWGPKRVVVIGIFVSSFSALGTSAVSNISEMAVLRFLVGSGMAFVFAPGIVIIARLLRGGKSGMGVGLFNSAYDLGGLVALFGWVVVATVTGWRASLALSGAIGVATGVLALLFVPGEKTGTGLTASAGPLLNILRDRRLILIGLAMLGFDIGNTIIPGFMILYLVNKVSVSGTLAGLVTSLVVVIPIFAALWAGRAYDRISRHRVIMVLAVLASAASLAIGAYPSIYAAVACAALGGVVAGVGYTFAFAGARDFNREGAEYEGLAISWVNSIHLTGSVIPPVLFASLVESLGYPQAWLWSGALTLLFVVPVLLLAARWGR